MFTSNVAFVAKVILNIFLFVSVLSAVLDVSIAVSHKG